MTEEPTEPSSQASAPAVDPLRRSRTSSVWVALTSLGVLLLLLIIFIAQNTQDVEIRFLGWEGQSPLAVALLAASVAGIFLSVIAGSLRILQLRRRVKRDKKAGFAA
jgi:uncharacterized integral membrane protein